MNPHSELEHQSSMSLGHNAEPSRQQQSDSLHLRKREWEIGHNTQYNDIDDKQQLKRKE
jgi:hypothetical protein